MSGIDKYVKSILHFDTDFTDESGSIWTASGTVLPIISANQSKFGGKSLYFNGVGKLYSVKSNEFNLGTSDFTIDWWEYRTTSANGSNLDIQFLSYANSFTSFDVGYVNAGNVTTNISSNNTSWNMAQSVSMGAVVLNAWSHRALVRSGSNFYTFKDGVLISKFTSALSILISNEIHIAVNVSAIHYIDEVRFSKFARWTANFTPPTSAYSYDKYYLAKLSAGNYKTIKSGTWVDLGTPADDTALVSLMQANGTYYPPKQSDLESIATGANRPKRVCWQDTVGATIPTIKLSAIPQDKLLLPKSLISMYTYSDIVAMTTAQTITDYKRAVSLMHFDTDFTDESGKAWTAYGTPTVSAVQSKFGGKSLFLNGTTDYLTTPASSDFNFGTGDFTIDWWEYRTSIADITGAVFSTLDSNTPNRSILIGVTISGKVTMHLSSVGSSWDIINGGIIGTPILNTLIHRAVVRKGSIISAYENGNLTLSVSSTASILYNSFCIPVIGAQIIFGTGTFGNKFTGYVDEFRVSKGARWTEPFTPPALAYTMDNLATIRIILSLDLVNYKTFNFTSQAWETIDPTNLTAVKTNGISAPLLSTITEAQWASLIGTSSGVAIGFLLSENSVADSCLLDNLAMTVNMKGSWDHAVYGTNVTYGYTNNNVLTVKLITAGSFKINYCDTHSAT